ncbi:MAG: hypothetical protein KTR31_03275 [Myxococcales bacterium]|nr:hypothetical protein [Myxococcales bacterium]
MPLVPLLSMMACAPQQPAPPDPAPAIADTPSLTVEELAADAERTALVPSPSETQRALQASGIEVSLADLIPTRRFDFDAAEPDRAAVRTGVVLADMLLSVRTSDTDALVGQLGAIAKGMEQLDGGQDILLTLADLQKRVAAEAVTRDELLKELDELSGAVIPELQFNGRERVVPLIQAGSWLEGAHLVSRALKGSAKPEAAAALLKAPDVVGYFHGYAKQHGSAEVSPTVTVQLDQCLTKLQAIAGQPEPLSDEDLATVASVTQDVLSML